MLCDPDGLLGDFDSASPQAVDALVSLGAWIEHFPTQKDETDTQLAVERAILMGATQVTLAGGMGGRLDHALGNLQLLMHLEERGIPAMMVSGHCRAWAACRCMAIPGKPGDLLSLIPFGTVLFGMFGILYSFSC